MFKLLRNIDRWCQYNNDYIKIQKNPYARRAMRNDPGVKFMRRGWQIVWLIICLIALYGRLSS